MYHCVYRRSSAPVQVRTNFARSVKRYEGPASGCKGLESLRSSTPCPWPFPRQSARSLAGRGRFANAQGQGLRPCTPARCARTLALVISRPFHRLSATQGSVGSWCLERLLPGAFYFRSTSLYGDKENASGSNLEGIRRPGDVSTPEALPRQWSFRCYGGLRCDRQRSWLFPVVVGSHFYSMNRQSYHAEVVTNFQGMDQVLDIRTFANPAVTGGAPIIELTCWNKMQGTEVYSAGIFTPEKARTLARHLLKAADDAERT